MRLVLISDTHCFHDRIKVPEGDVLVFAGDLLLSGSAQEAVPAAVWLGAVAKQFTHVVFVAGNHDRYFEKLGYDRTQDFFSDYAENIHYLLDSSINIAGKTFWGSPYTPEFNNWAFNVPRGAPIREHWRRIPDKVDVLITHGPPAGILDQSAPHLNSEHLGCLDLHRQVQISLPEIMMFGHIHGGRGSFERNGVKYFNATAVNEAYKPVYEPWITEI